MPQPVTINTAELKATTHKLQVLPIRAQRRALPKAVRSGGAVYSKSARREVPKTNRILQRSLVHVVRRYDGAVFAVIGQDIGKTISKKQKIKQGSGGISGAGKTPPIHLVDQPVGPHTVAPHSQWLRFTINGTAYWAKRIEHPGHGGADFMRRAASMARAAAIAATEQKLEVEIEKETTALTSA